MVPSASGKPFSRPPSGQRVLMTHFEIIAGLASVAGAGFSLAAFLQARSAKVAAEEARDRTLIRSLADEFEVACSKIDQLLDFLRSDRLPEAGLRSQSR